MAPKNSLQGIFRFFFHTSCILPAKKHTLLENRPTYFIALGKLTHAEKYLAVEKVERTGTVKDGVQRCAF